MNRLMMLAALGSLTVAAGCASTGATKSSTPSGTAVAPAAAAAPAAPAAAAPVAAGGGGGTCAGDWKIEFQTPMGNQTVPMKLAQNGEQITGKATDPNSGDDADVKGTCKGDAMAISQTAQSPMGPIELAFTGKVSGSHVAGTVKFGNLGEGDFVGNK